MCLAIFSIIAMGKQHARKKKGNKNWGAKKANAASGGGGDAGEDKQARKV